MPWLGTLGGASTWLSSGAAPSAGHAALAVSSVSAMLMEVKETVAAASASYGAADKNSKYKGHCNSSSQH